MLNEGKHLWPISSEARFEINPRLKAWPRGLRPLRCSFASLRMTLQDGFVEFVS
jgi:hypothetical protein